MTEESARLPVIPLCAETLSALADAAPGMEASLLRATLRMVALVLRREHDRASQPSKALQAHAESTQLRDLKLRGLAELAAGAAHEINNPLAVILGQAQQLLKTEESPDRIRALERVVGQSRRIHELLNGLMLYARPPKPRQELVCLDALARKAVESLGELALEREVEVRYAEQPGHGSEVMGDPELLQTAVTELLRNAVEAAPARGWAQIRIESHDALAEVIVEDNGPGLTAKQREHLFDPFYSGRSAGRGRGLGLTKVWRIAQLHGGEIRFTTDPGQPTRFVLTLPGARRVERVAESSQPKESRNGRRDGKPRRNGRVPARRKRG